MRTSASVLLGFALIGAGCSKKPDANPTFGAAFKKTESHVREFAEQAVEAEEKNDYSTASRHYGALSRNPDLTQEQRDLANDSMLKMNAKLRESAEKGDQKAAQVLEDYRATK